jgi:hypothetical protein
MAEFAESPEYLRGKTDFNLGIKSVKNPWATGDEQRPFAAWLWSCGWSDACVEWIAEIRAVDRGFGAK